MVVARLGACKLGICHLCKSARPMIVHLVASATRASWHDSRYYHSRLREPLPQEAYDCQQPAPTRLV